MKQVLSLLVAYVFLQVQTWAHTGGPTYAGSTAAVQGTYAGTLIAQTPLAAGQAVGSNGLGIFAIGFPTSGIGSGVLAIFNSGGTFFGSIVGVADPDELTVTALLAEEDATETVNNNGTITTVSVPSGFAAGSLIATLDASNNATGSSAHFRITGVATLTVSPVDPTTGAIGAAGAPVSYDVDGFQQSTDSTGTTINLSALTGTTATPTSTTGS